MLTSVVGLSTSKIYSYWPTSLGGLSFSGSSNCGISTARANYFIGRIAVGSNAKLNCGALKLAHWVGQAGVAARDVIYYRGVCPYD